MIRGIALLLLTAASLAAQPFIRYRGVVNGASYAAQGLPNSGIARGSIFTIFGRGLGPDQPAQQPSLPLVNELAGVSVQVIQGGISLPAIPVYVSSAQISAIMPSNAPLGRGAIRVRFNNRASNPGIVTVVEASVGIITLNSTGFGPALVQNFVPNTDNPINTTRVTAKRGQTVILWATGLGAVPHADNIAPTGGDLPTKVEVFVGGKLAPRRYSGRTGCCAGLDQIVFDVPADAPSGCYVPIQIRTNGTTVSNAATMAIEPDGGPCSDVFNPLGEALRHGGRIGIVAPHRFDLLIDDPDPPVPNIVDQIDVALQKDDGGETWFNPVSALPPVGSCTFYGGQTASTLADLIGLVAPRSRLLDGGASLQVSGGAAPVSVNRRAADFPLYRALLGRQSVPGKPPLFFSFPGSFNFGILGGSDVQAAQATFQTSEAVRWTNRDQITEIDRARGLTLSWTGGDAVNDVVVIGLLSSADADNAAGLGLCVASSGAGSLAVPSEILASLPATSPNAVQTPAWIFVGSARVRNPSRFSAPGLDGTFIVPGSVSGRWVTVR